MKKIWIIALIVTIIIVAIVSLVIILNNRKKVEIIADNIKLIHFSYSTGTMIYSNVRYAVDEKEGKYIAAIKPNEIPDDDEKEIEIDENILNKIVEILNKYDVSSWNDFHENDTNVLDGDSFSFYLRTNDKETINASGYMRYPKNYLNVKKELDSIFNDLYNNN